MAEIILGGEGAWVEVSTDTRRRITVSVHVDIEDRERIRELVEELTDWLKVSE